MTDPVENAFNVWQDNTLLPDHVSGQLDMIRRNVPPGSIPGSIIDLTVRELNDMIGAAFRAGWDHAEIYAGLPKPEKSITDYPPLPVYPPDYDADRYSIPEE